MKEGKIDTGGGKKKTKKSTKEKIKQFWEKSKTLTSKQSLYQAKVRYHELDLVREVSTLGRAAIDKYKERRQYRYITSQTKQGKGLVSIYGKVGAGAQQLAVHRRGSASDPESSSPSTSMENRSLDDSLSMDENYDIILALRKSQLFSWLPDSILVQLSQIAVREEWENGALIQSAGEKMEVPCLHLIVSGHVAIHLKTATGLHDPKVMSGNSKARDRRLQSKPNKQSQTLLQHRSSLSDMAYTSQSKADEDKVLLGAGEVATGMVGLLSTIMNEPTTPLCSLHATSRGTQNDEDSTVTAKFVFDGGLSRVLEMFSGLREELLQRTLMKMDRVLFMAIFRLTGHIYFPLEETGSRRDRDQAALSVEMGAVNIQRDTAHEVQERTVAFLSRELGLSKKDLASCVAVEVCPNKHAAQAAHHDGVASTSEAEAPTADPSKVTVKTLLLEEDQQLLHLSQSEAMYIVLEGKLEVLVGIPGDAKKSRVQREIAVCGCIGHLSLITGTWNNWYRRSPTANSNECVWVRAVGGDATLAQLLQDDYFHLSERYPQMLAHKARNLLHQLNPVSKLIDITTAWQYVHAGQMIVHEKDPCHMLYIVLHGRLRGGYFRKVRPPSKAKKGQDAKKKPPPAAPTSSAAATPTSSSSSSSSRPKGDDASPPPLDFNFSDEAGFSVVREYGSGSLVGEVSFLTEDPMHLTIFAMRNTQLATISKASMRMLLKLDPDMLFDLGRTISRNLTSTATSEHQGGPTLAMQNHPHLGIVPRQRNNFAYNVIAVVPASPTAPVELFLHTMSATLRTMAMTTEVLNSDIVERMAEERKFGISQVSSKPKSSMEEMLLLAWLSESEETNDVLFYQADPWSRPEPSWWSYLCVEQADLILFVANANDNPDMSTLEEKLSSVRTNARKELVLLHMDASSNSTKGNSASSVGEVPSPVDTRKWIVNRKDIIQHHHIRFHPNTMDRESGGTGLFDVQHFKSDFRRLSRWLIGQSVGLVLGGGGARGCAHLAVMRCMEELGIPVDFVAGTSIGAYMGGLYAMKTDTLFMWPVISHFAGDMSSVSKKVRDLTLPVTSYFTGESFNRTIVKTFEGLQIEDLWIPFFCMSTDLTDSVEIAHRNGACWKYVRASMTLVNYMPPICDVVETMDSEGEVHYLADGGYMNNLPVDIMREMLGDRATIIAVDVQGSWKFAGYNYGDHLSGWWYLYAWLNPWIDTPKIPTSADMQTQLAYISSVKQGSTKAQSKDPSSYSSSLASNNTDTAASKSPPPANDLRAIVNLYLTPPVGDYGTLEFDKFKEIEAKSYDHVRASILHWIESMKREDIRKYQCVKFTRPRESGIGSGGDHRQQQPGHAIGDRPTTQPQRALRTNRRSLSRSRSWGKLPQWKSQMQSSPGKPL
jgi:lysophospholipid hydrolase